MACEDNVIKGRQLVLLARNDADTAWEIIGGVRTRGYTLDSSVEDTTSSSTTGNFSDSEYTGYSNATFNISGVADKRTGIVDPATGFTVVGSSRLLQIANPGAGGTVSGEFRMLNVDSGGYVEGCFNVTSFSRTGDTPGLLSYEATLQSKSEVIIVGEP